MPSDQPEQTTIRRLSQVTTLIRGLLATASGNDDDPYQRVLVKCLPGVASLNHGAVTQRPPLLMKTLDAGIALDALRDRLQETLNKYVVQHGGPPEAIILEGMGTLHIKYPAAEYHPLRNKVALVTGAAGAIGAGICKGLLNGGCHVAVTDRVQETLDELVNELSASTPDRVIGVRMDVTDKHDVADGFAAVGRTWGGVDIVIVNAGIALVASLMDMDLEAFRKLEQVNVEGTLLTLAEAGRWMSLQGIGGDMVLVSTKNVFAPGAQFGAYSATKAASHQLARIAALELAPFGIRVNMVAPDAVFSDGKRKSGLWAEVGPSRMQARGLDEKGLEEYYRNRNLLKTRITPAHVANAVLFFVTRQTPTTGVTLPVDGGLPDATPR
ncbi:MAG: SDR family NAD(P)-dependent oxidoreductase [Verrucomicrobia bacterium]|nr:SDR family NAD(P)-dependent oxidoreductase [Verrucomicrobiota bacterium]MBU4290029.1 SDR family NAD(P)-dependent oxidoreductase [Verrucomicrobiota bacterium]MBU4430071.1 SDR family NAD(P)-dependent oxidoreductase [Verrucomicrobiota bacterium]MCG2679600.1 SDR family NAD(P)-dependent oxidoreductase [Kiritimatiellia bacterium]